MHMCKTFRDKWSKVYYLYYIQKQFKSSTKYTLEVNKMLSASWTNDRLHESVTVIL